MQQSLQIFFFFQSFDQMELYDLPATIDYIFEQTAHEKWTLIGMSMGAKVSFVHLSSMQNYNKKVNLLICHKKYIVISCWAVGSCKWIIFVWKFFQ